MGKVLKIAAVVVGVAVNVIPGAGQFVSGTIFGALGAVGGTVGAFASAAFTFSQVATMGLAVAGLGGALGFVTKALGLGPKPPKPPPANEDRLRAGLDPRAFRKIMFGVTAASIDVHYQEFTGTDQEFLNSILTHASHQMQSIDEIWFDEKKTWSAIGGVTSEFAGYLSVQAIPVGAVGSSFTILGSSSWTAASSRLIGCAYTWLRYKRFGITKKAESPFASNITSRITVRGKGALMYDPRLDSTRGGSGSHRAENQATWAWVSNDVGRNPALQLLWYLLGWRIQNPSTLTWKLAVGLGLPPERIDFESFMAAANLCDEPVTLAAGGTEPRYRSDGVFSEGDDPSVVFENLLAAMNGVLRDAGGKLVLSVLHNDLATPVVSLTEADVIGDFTWLQTPPIDQSFNVVRGRYVDASDAGLYQMADFPEVFLPSPDGIERPSPPFNLSMVQSPGQAQRLAKQYLQRAQYPGSFSANFLASAWRCEVGSVIEFTFPALAFDAKLFRVLEHSISLDGTCQMAMREEHPSIYAWDDEDSPAVTAQIPISYDPLNEPWVQAIGGLEVDLVDTQGDLAVLDGNFNSRNDRIATTPVAPTVSGGGVCIDHTQNTDGSVDLSFEWNFTGTEEWKNDGFEVEVWASTSSAAYTPGSNTMSLVTQVPIERRAFILQGVPANLYYTFAVRTYRKIDHDIALVLGLSQDKTKSAWVKSVAAGENPYLPNSNPAFAGDITGTVAGRSATTVAASIRSDGTIASGKVLEDSIDPSAVNVAVTARTSGTVTVPASNSAQRFMTLSTPIAGHRVVVTFSFNFQILVTNPTLDTRYQFDVDIYCAKPSDPVVICDPQFSEGYTWRAANKTATDEVVYEGSRTFEVVQDGLPAGNYEFGFIVTTPAGNKVRILGERAMRIVDMRAAN